MNAKKLAVEALKKQIQKIAFDANLFDRGLADYPHAEHCSRERKKLLVAIVKLEGGSASDAADRAIVSPKLNDPAQLSLPLE